MSCSVYHHGWPFIALERSVVIFYGDWRNGKYVPGAKPKNTDFDEFAKQSLDTEPAREYLIPDWRLGTKDIPGWSTGIMDSDLWPVRFWTSRSHWPWFSKHDGIARSFSWLGLAGNIFVLSVICVLFAMLLEFRRRRRGRHLAFSLLEILVAFGMFGVLVAFLRNEFVRAKTEQQVVRELDSTFRDGAQGYFDGERTNGLPSLVSQIVDHRSRWPYADLHVFRPVESAYLEVYDVADVRDEIKEQIRTRLVRAICDAPFPISMGFEVNRETIEILRGISNASSLQELKIRYDFELEWDSQADNYIDDVVLELDFALPNARKLSVWLQEGVDQKKMLRPLESLSHLQELNISGVDSSGAKYLSSIRDRLPRNTIIDLERDVNRSEFPKLELLFDELPDD